MPPKVKSPEQFNKEMYERYGDDVSVLSRYTKASEPLDVRFNKCGHEVTVTASNVHRGYGCVICRNTNLERSGKWTNEDFSRKLKERKGNTVELVGEYTNIRHPVKVLHKTCGRVMEVIPSDYLKKNRTICYECFIESYRTHPDEYANRVKEEVGDEYEVTKPYYRAIDKVGFKHRICGHEFEMLPDSFLRGSRCPKCFLSTGELEVHNVLERLNVKYIGEKKLGGVLRADFYLPKYQAIIEYDGQQHFEPIKFFGGEKSFKETVRRDTIKEHYCRFLGFPLLRIPYWEFDNIPQIVTEFIEELEEGRKKRKEDDLLDGE